MSTTVHAQCGGQGWERHIGCFVGFCVRIDIFCGWLIRDENRFNNTGPPLSGSAADVRRGTTPSEQPSGWVVASWEYGLLDWVIMAARPRLGGMVVGGERPLDQYLSVFKPSTDMANSRGAGVAAWQAQRQSWCPRCAKAARGPVILRTRRQSYLAQLSGTCISCRHRTKELRKHPPLVPGHAAHTVPHMCNSRNKIYSAPVAQQRTVGLFSICNTQPSTRGIEKRPIYLKGCTSLHLPRGLRQNIPTILNSYVYVPGHPSESTIASLWGMRCEASSRGPTWFAPLCLE